MTDQEKEFKNEEQVLIPDIDDQKCTKKQKKIALISLISIVSAAILGVVIFLIVHFTKKTKDKPLIINPSSGIHTHTIIFLHGVNSLPKKFESFWLTNITFVKKNTTKIVLLHAPRQKTTYNNNKTTSWFDILSMPLNSEKTYNFDDVQKSSKILQENIEKEAKILGGNYSKIFIGGHSQGAIVSVYTGYTVDYMIGGVLVCNGFLCPQAKIKERKENLNVFLAHGGKDQAIPIEFHNETVQRIVEYSGVKKFFYENEGHAINKMEEKDLGEFLDANMI